METELICRERARAVIFYEMDSGLQCKECKNNDSVFVEIVQLVKCSKGIIPSLVWFYCIDDEVTELSSDLLFKSAINGLFKFIPRFMCRKMDIRGHVIPAQSSHNLRDGVIERGSQVVNDISDHRPKRKILCGRLPEISAEIASFRVFIDERRVEISRQEFINPRLRLLDVLIGPFNLSSRAKKVRGCHKSLI